LKDGFEDAGHALSNSPACCAERRFLNSWIEKGRKSGVPSHGIIRWVRRKIGPEISTWRYLADGSEGCALPCILCKAAIMRFDLRVCCTMGGGERFRGFLDDDDAPVSKFTGKQLRMFCKG